MEPVSSQPQGLKREPQRTILKAMDGTGSSELALQLSTLMQAQTQALQQAMAQSLLSALPVLPSPATPAGDSAQISQAGLALLAADLGMDLS